MENTTRYRINTQDRLSKMHLNPNNSTANPSLSDTHLHTVDTGEDILSIGSHVISVGDVSGSCYFELTNNTEDRVSSKAENTPPADSGFSFRVLIRPKMIMFLICMLVYSSGCAMIFSCVPALASEGGEWISYNVL